MVVVAVLDDLMFSSKIRAAATGVGASVTFARSRDAAVAAVREHQPALVIVDLDNPRTDPIGVIGALQDGLPSRPRVLGYVSHVRADLVEAARQAGADLVVARSAFTQGLPGFLADQANTK